MDTNFTVVVVDFQTFYIAFNLHVINISEYVKNKFNFE